ncbi:hypothetical protein GMRT_12779 [Giardia muris]|uniref:Uncharacterized protein n=1 Tax=Giardia muris TaxID=5742 RepID=A0A4Z1T409_GIAMU|nr:hypothetical protein GMRT_12779 [Giardia muris]|eukprot:TNJ27141.1 hypothetical protein GMRT_12779 [Giardia muris]
MPTSRAGSRERSSRGASPGLRRSTTPTERYRRGSPRTSASPSDACKKRPSTRPRVRVFADHELTEAELGDLLWLDSILTGDGRRHLHSAVKGLSSGEPQTEIRVLRTEVKTALATGLIIGLALQELDRAGVSQLNTLNHHPRNETERVVVWEKVLRVARANPSFDTEVRFSSKDLATGSETIFLVIRELREAFSGASRRLRRASSRVSFDTPSENERLVQSVDSKAMKDFHKENLMFLGRLSQFNREQRLLQKKELLERVSGHERTPVDIKRTRSTASSGASRMRRLSTSALPSSKAAENNIMELVDDVTDSLRLNSIHSFAERQDGDIDSRALNPPFLQDLILEANGIHRSIIYDTLLNVLAILPRAWRDNRDRNLTFFEDLLVGIDDTIKSLVQEYLQAACRLYTLLEKANPTSPLLFMCWANGRINSWLRASFCVPPSELEIDNPIIDPYRNGVGLAQVYNLVFHKSEFFRDVCLKRELGTELHACYNSIRSNQPSSNSRLPRSLGLRESCRESEQKSSSGLLVLPYPTPRSIPDCTRNTAAFLHGLLGIEAIPTSLVASADALVQGDFKELHQVLYILYTLDILLNSKSNTARSQPWQGFDFEAGLRLIQELCEFLSASPTSISREVSSPQPIPRTRREMDALVGICHYANTGPLQPRSGSNPSLVSLRRSLSIERSVRMRGGTDDELLGYFSELTQTVAKNCATRLGELSRVTATLNEWLYSLDCLSHADMTAAELSVYMSTGVPLCKLVGTIFGVQLNPVDGRPRNSSIQFANIRRALELCRERYRFRSGQLPCLDAIDETALGVQRAQIGTVIPLLCELHKIYFALRRERSSPVATPTGKRPTRSPSMPSILGSRPSKERTPARADASVYISDFTIRAPTEMDVQSLPGRLYPVIGPPLPPMTLPVSIAETLVQILGPST